MPNLRRNSVISRLPSFSTADAVHLDRAGVGPQQADDVLQEHALARARAADDHQRLGRGHVEAQPVQHHLGAEGLAEIADVDLGILIGHRYLSHRYLGHWYLGHQNSNRVRKKSEIRIAMLATTTAAVVERPTPSAPPVV